MNTSSSKSGSILSEKRIKLHHFETSNRKIWTIVGEKKEYWLDPDLDFCSCPGYYFNRIHERRTCYHLKTLKIAREQNKIEKISFSDSEYEDFIASLLSDL
tara:strand:- start:321 stop:623 length:303 start_codon:yes stop_codon:yes gene_type:complete